MSTSSDKYFDKDKAFWDNYLKGRPQPPESFFKRIFDYHRNHGGKFDTVHDVGAGNGPYASLLSRHFAHVILSDVAPSNMELAKQRLGTGANFTYRVAKLHETDGVAPRSVDMVFATNVMHFVADQKADMAAMAEQLKPGGTFACAVFGPARFEDAKLQNLWGRISQQGGRGILRKSEDPDQIAAVIARTDGLYNVAPLGPEIFAPGALRIHLNMSKGGLTPLMPPEEAHRNVEPNYTGPNDVEKFEDDDGWKFEVDGPGVLEHMLSFPFVDPKSASFKDLLQELDTLLGANGGKAKFRGWWPAKLILATVNDKH